MCVCPVSGVQETSSPAPAPAPEKETETEADRKEVEVETAELPRASTPKVSISASETGPPWSLKSDTVPGYGLVEF